MKFFKTIKEVIAIAEEQGGLLKMKLVKTTKETVALGMRRGDF